jgi:HSP20 family protein
MRGLIPRSFYIDDFFNDYKAEKVMNTDIYEKDGKYFIEIDLPGADKKDIDLTYDKGYLNISYNKTFDEEKEEPNYLYRERRLTSAKRSFYLGQINEKTLDAKYEDGILKIVAEKSENEKKLIEIK